MISYILFDLDGTLTNPKEMALQNVCNTLWMPLVFTNRTWINWFPLSVRHCYSLFRNFTALRRKMPLPRWKISGTVQHHRLVRKFPYRHCTYAAAAAGPRKNAGVASSKPTVFVKQILEKFELSQYFASIEGSNLDGTRTDKKEVISAVLQNFNNPPMEQLLMVGDRKYDVIGAKELGLPCVASGLDLRAGRIRKQRLPSILPKQLPICINIYYNNKIQTVYNKIASSFYGIF